MMLNAHGWSKQAIGVVAFVATIGVVALAVVLMTHQEARPATTQTARLHGDYMLDLGTGARTPIPERIMVSVAEFGRSTGEKYAASPDGGMLAFVGQGDDDNPQIFVAETDGFGIRQLTHDVREAMSPAWSPDGKKLAYVGYGAKWNGNETRLFVVDVATGVSTRITSERGWSPQFTPDGSSIIYTSDVANAPILKVVPAAGGRSKVFLAPNRGLWDTGDGSLSPDGKLVTFLGGGFPNEKPRGFHCGPCRFLANADGTGRRVLDGDCWASSPAGTWSPDGSRIVCSDDVDSIVLVDVASGRTSRVAEGKSAIWLDRQTLLIDAA
jgi:Tol biopolymer transport system component